MSANRLSGSQVNRTPQHLRISLSCLTAGLRFAGVRLFGVAVSREARQANARHGSARPCSARRCKAMHGLARSC